VIIIGLFDGLFKKSKIKIFSDGSYLTRNAPFSKDLYEQETVRAIIDCIATHTAKAEAMHVITDASTGRIKEIKRNSPYVKLLNTQPNSIMSGYDFKYKLITQLEVNTTAMAYIKWNGMTPEFIIPIQYTHFEFAQIETGGYAVRFIDYQGNEYILNLEDVIVVRKFYNTRDVGGDGNAPVYNTLDMLKASDDGLIESLNVANKIRGVYQQKKAMLSTDDVKNSTADFINKFKEAAKNGGIIGLDSMENYTQLTINPYSANAAQMKQIKSNLYEYWHICEDILTSNYDEKQWQAFYEGVIEPRLIMLGQAFTNVCFTQTEKNFGNKIIFNSSVLVNTSMQTKTNILTASKELGLFSRNELRELFGYAPNEGAEWDEAQVSLNFVKGSDQSAYQTGKEQNGSGTT
jgi:HK97 family phage portal protein